jgi:hypothetical protein
MHRTRLDIVLGSRPGEGEAGVAWGCKSPAVSARPEGEINKEKLVTFNLNKTSDLLDYVRCLIAFTSMQTHGAPQSGMPYRL